MSDWEEEEEREDWGDIGEYSDSKGGAYAREGVAMMLLHAGAEGLKTFVLGDDATAFGSGIEEFKDGTATEGLESGARTSRSLLDAPLERCGFSRCFSLRSEDLLILIPSSSPLSTFLDFWILPFSAVEAPSVPVPPASCGSLVLVSCRSPRSSPISSL